MSGPVALARPDRARSADLLTQAHEWTAPDPVDEPTPAAWVWQDMRAAARAAASRVSTTPGTAREADLVDVALSGVALAVALDPGIDWPGAVAAGAREVWDAVGATRHHHGMNSTGPMPRFTAYWLDWHESTPAPTRCETGMTLAAVLDALPDRHKETLAALAFTDSMTAAAELVGADSIAYRQRVRTARTAALELWFDGERPPPLSRLPINRRGRDRVCPAGHPITGDNVETERRAGRVVERCRTCRAGDRARYKETVA